MKVLQLLAMWCYYCYPILFRQEVGARSCNCKVGVTIGCFPQPCVDHIKSMEFHSVSSALAHSNYISARVAKLMAFVKVNTGCIDTLS